jgi:hypothetical protein
MTEIPDELQALLQTDRYDQVVEGKAPGCTCQVPTPYQDGMPREDQRHDHGCALAPDLSKCRRYSDGDFHIYVPSDDASVVYLVMTPGESESDGYIETVKLRDDRPVPQRQWEAAR